ncbi:hypothetical protein PISMIDRAFT_677174 [Pisolithus microcarpus 441]|uniref:Unplaced genomic scaffold scaffold_23, whole genome shotgun sequence n=1 Tax=Pisolithus microcarpus 441 TaxID=765257 RepID=A0A0C9Z8C1_9AGAM|nr:hypothetical protein PISMIDRAFT_677174 [Pisolithus microcarpus 441]
MSHVILQFLVFYRLAIWAEKKHATEVAAPIEVVTSLKPPTRIQDSALQEYGICS